MTSHHDPRDHEGARETVLAALAAILLVIGILIVFAITLSPALIRHPG